MVTMSWPISLLSAIVSFPIVSLRRRLTRTMGAQCHSSWWSCVSSCGVEKCKKGWQRIFFYYVYFVSLCPCMVVTTRREYGQAVRKQHSHQSMIPIFCPTNNLFDHSFAPGSRELDPKANSILVPIFHSRRLVDSAGIISESDLVRGLSQHWTKEMIWWKMLERSSSHNSFWRWYLLRFSLKVELSTKSLEPVYFNPEHASIVSLSLACSWYEHITFSPPIILPLLSCLTFLFSCQ